MIRDIHPIDQSGFSSEFHEEDERFFVYDCGVFSCGRVAKNPTKDALPQTPITGFFVSHFGENRVLPTPELAKRPQNTDLGFAGFEKSKCVMQLLKNLRRYHS